MMNSDAIKVAEYESLRQEITQNKKYIFERPLLVIGVIGLAASQLEKNPIALLLPAMLVSMLWLNLWFTVNRIRSTARIVAYISLILESKNERWIGWETALNKYRLWAKEHFNKFKENLEFSNNREAMKFDATWSYHIILWLHVVAVLLGVFGSGVYAFKNPKALEIVLSILTVSISIGFLITCLKPFNPKKLSRLVEIQQKIWTEVLLK